MAEARLNHKALTWTVVAAPLQHCHREGKVEASARIGRCFSGGRMSKKDCSNEETGFLDEVGAGNGAEGHLTGYVEMEPERIKLAQPP